MARIGRLLGFLIVLGCSLILASCGGRGSGVPDASADSAPEITAPPPVLSGGLPAFPTEEDDAEGSSRAASAYSVGSYDGADYELAECHALAGEEDEALRWLENAVSRGFINYPLISRLDPFLENVRGGERFEKLMKRVKYEWEHFEA